MHSPFHIRNGVLYSALLLAIVSQSNAFEQGSYYLIDLVENAEAKPVAGRLAVPKSVLAERVATETPTASAQERSEFEIDFSEGLRSTSNSAFDFNAPLETTTETDTTDFSSGTFDFGDTQSNTVFGQ